MISIPKGAIMSAFANAAIDAQNFISIPKGAIMRRVEEMKKAGLSIFQFQKVRL